MFVIKITLSFPNTVFMFLMQCLEFGNVKGGCEIYPFAKKKKFQR